MFTLTNNPTLVFTVVKISTTEGPLDMSKIDENAKVGVLFQNTEVSACFMVNKVFAYSSLTGVLIIISYHLILEVFLLPLK